MQPGAPAPSASPPPAGPPSTPPDAPDPAAFDDHFHTYETRVENDEVRYYGEPLGVPETVVRDIWQVFHEHGYEVELTVEAGRYVLVATEQSYGIDGIPWKNVLLFLATVFTTLFVGAQWYLVDPVADPVTALTTAWPFSAAVMGVLMTHELGHYVASRYHRVNASLPYFIPFPSLIGTMGAVIRMKGRMPDRKALFDIGASGPLAGLAATIVVTVVGLYLPPIPVDPSVLNAEGTVTISLGFPPLMHVLSWVTGQPLEYGSALNVNPVVIGGWVGAFVTVLNLIPVGQLDGGHITRAVFGEDQSTLAAFVPVSLFGLAGYLHYVERVTFQAVVIWVFWGVLTLVVGRAGTAEPVRDDPLDRRRLVLAALTFVLGAACFMPVPVLVSTT
ncbi:site-2 protease family protein [Halorubellus sp. JP-L1]|uniref:site-2 protease family protein n=1 Tax=Halorubellus sp. JP-L1 TaxID=2715753 RepID=UPI0018776B6E|nr:site-2 protease family protein [Halorubellus sp. JP-L1]